MNLMRQFEMAITMVFGALLLGIVVMLFLYTLAAGEKPSPISPYLLPTPTTAVITFPPIRTGCVSSGCNGELCVDAGKMTGGASICQYKEEYSCLTHSRCELQPSGSCGWTHTDQYYQCVARLFASSKNVAFRKPIIAFVGQVDYLDYAQRFSPANITDGDRDMGWRTETDNVNGSSGAQAIIDLLDHHRLTSITYVVNWDSKPEYDKTILFRVSLSNAASLDSATGWTILSDRYASVADNNQPITVSFKPVSARFIKVEYVHDDDQWAGWGNIQEVEAYEN